MTEKKNEASKEIKSYFKNFIILSLSVVPLYFEKSVAGKILNTKNDKLLWLIDLGFYNLIFSVIISFVLYIISANRTNVDVKLYFSEDKLSEVTLESISKKIFLDITIRGNRDHIPDKLIINYPDWLDFQMKGANYITPEDSLNQYHFDLQKMINNQKEVDLTVLIPIDILRNSQEENKIKIIPEFPNINLKRKIRLRTKIKAIKIKLKGI